MCETVYIHVDNGGIEFAASVDVDGITTLRWSTSYFGYPSVSSELSGFISPDDLRKIADAINNHASSLEHYELLRRLGED